jgi:tight adherence protein B
VKLQAVLCYLAGMLAALVATGAAHGGVRLGGVDATGYPAIQASVVGSSASAQPPFVREGGAPVVDFQARNLGSQKAVVLALDNSRSMTGAPLADARAAAQVFVTLKGANDRVGVVTFGHRAFALTGFSEGTGDAATALGAVTVDARTGTALYDAVVLAAQRLAAQPLPGRVIVLLTDGHDVSSAASLDEAIDEARRAQAVVYPIAVAAPGFDPSPLLRLARSTGGSYHTAGTSRALRTVYASIAAELSRTWRISYTTAARPGETLNLHAALPGLGAADAQYTLPGDTRAPVPPSNVVPSSLYGSVGTALLGLAVAFLTVLALGMLYAGRGGSRLRAKLDAHVTPAATRAKRRRSSAQAGLRRQLFHAVEQAFGDFRRFKSLQRLLERADLPVRASEFLFIQLGAAFLFGLVFAVAGTSPLVTLGAMLGAGLAPRGFASFRAKARLRSFENQLPDLLITMAASLKAGHSFRQGIQTVVEEGRPPASEEFKRVLTETSLGRPMDDALKDMAERVGSKNLEFVVTAVTIQRQVGGSLAGLFDMVADAVRQRQQFARKIRGLTAMGRMSAYVLVGLPIFLALVLTLMNPTYMSPLYHTSTGHELIAVGIVGIGIGSLFLRKIVSFRG